MIKVFCCFYNEAVLIPFFLSHYHYVDAIHACVSRSLDATRDLLAADPRVTIQDLEMPKGMDDDLKIGWLNAALHRLDRDHLWHLVVDADEFVWPPGDPTGETAGAYLASVPDADLALMVRLANVYRVDADTDLDPAQVPVVFQRRHGMAAGPDGIVFQKSSLIRANRGLTFGVGHHGLVGSVPVSQTHWFEGAHWQNADPSFASTRRVRDRTHRQSPNNLKRGYGSQHANLTVEAVARELEAHRHDGAVF